MPMGRKCTSEELAGLIVDALIDAEIIKREAFDEAVRIAAIEIDARKGVGDY